MVRSGRSGRCCRPVFASSIFGHAAATPFRPPLLSSSVVLQRVRRPLDPCHQKDAREHEESRESVVIFIPNCATHILLALDPQPNQRNVQNQPRRQRYRGAKHLVLPLLAGQNERNATPKKCGRCIKQKRKKERKKMKGVRRSKRGTGGLGPSHVSGRERAGQLA